MGQPFGEQVQEQNSTEIADTQQQVGDTQSPSPAAPSINPIYAEALDGVPPEFHPKLVEKFKRWDENHANSLKKWEPFKEFEGVDPQNIRQSRAIYDAIAADPVGVYQKMQQNLIQQGLIPDPSVAGYAAQQVRQQAPETLSQNYEQDQQQTPAGIDPVLAQRLENIETFAQWQIEQQQRAQYEAQSKQIEDQLVQQLNQVQEQYSRGDEGLDRQFMQQVIERLGIAHRAGSPITPQQAAAQIQTYNDQVIADYNARRRIAPRVVPTQGGIPQEATKRPEDMSPDEQRAYGQWIAQGRQGAFNL
jgi:hypothetical protein